jgi:hypothetical protein
MPGNEMGTRAGSRCRPCSCAYSGRRRLTVAYHADVTPASSRTRRLSGLLTSSITRAGTRCRNTSSLSAAAASPSTRHARSRASSRCPVREDVIGSGPPPAGSRPRPSSSCPAAVRRCAAASSSASPCADSRCSISRDPRRETRTTRTAVVPDVVRTVRMYGTRPLHRPRLVRKFSPYELQTQRSARRDSREPAIVSQLRSAANAWSSSRSTGSADRSRFSVLYSGSVRWGGWGSNPRPADYEEPGTALRARCLHRYHGVVPLMTLIAPFAQMARSTNRSTLYHDDHLMLSQNVTAARPTSAPAPGGIRPQGSRTLLAAEPLDLDYKHEIIRRIHQ